MPGLSHSENKAFTYVQGEPPLFQLVPTASGPATGKHLAASPVHPSFNVLMMTPPERSPLQAEQSQLFQPFLKEEMPTIIFTVLCSILPGSSTSLFYWGLLKDTFSKRRFFSLKVVDVSKFKPEKSKDLLGMVNTIHFLTQRY